MKGNVLLLVILFITVSIMQLILNYSVSGYLYYNRSNIMFSRAGLDGGIYYINITPYDQSTVDKLGEIVEELEKDDSVDKIIKNKFFRCQLNMEFFQAVLYDEDVYQKMYGKLPYGDWGSGDEEQVCAVIAGVMPQNAPVGKTAKLGVSIDNKIEQFDIMISGVISYPPMVFDMSYYSSVNMTADKFFDSRSVLYLPDNEKTKALLGDAETMGMEMYAGIVLFDDSATAEERKAVSDKLNQYSEVLEIDDIISNTKHLVKEKLLVTTSLPMYLLVISILGYMSICVITIYRKKYDYSNYQIIGCSKRSIMTLTVLQISFPAILSMALFVCLMSVLRSLSQKGIYTLPNLIFGYENILVSVLATVIVILSIVLVTYYMMKSFSPLQELRKMEK